VDVSKEWRDCRDSKTQAWDKLAGKHSRGKKTHVLRLRVSGADDTGGGLLCRHLSKWQEKSGKVTNPTFRQRENAGRKTRDGDSGALGPDNRIVGIAIFTLSDERMLGATYSADYRKGA